MIESRFARVHFTHDRLFALAVVPCDVRYNILSGKISEAGRPMLSLSSVNEARLPAFSTARRILSGRYPIIIPRLVLSFIFSSPFSKSYARQEAVMTKKGRKASKKKNSVPKYAVYIYDYSFTPPRATPAIMNLESNTYAIMIGTILIAIAR